MDSIATNAIKVEESNTLVGNDASAPLSENGQQPAADGQRGGKARRGDMGASRVTFSSDQDGSLDLDELRQQTGIMQEMEVTDEEEREGWDNKWQFMMGVISYAVGLGNVWRFPYLCQQNGGGAFLIPYVIMLVLEGMPLFLIEMGIGQRLRQGPVPLWNMIHPYLGGVGVSSAVVSFLVALYYNVIITWCLFYLFHSFQSPLPWGTCPNVTMNGASVVDPECTSVNTSETAFFWYRTAIDTTGSIGDLGGINWSMAACLLAAWIIVWLCVMKGIKTSGKVMYVTATFPYMVTTVYLVRGVTLPGASAGIAYMFTPDISRLFDARVWLDAASQIFYSMGLAFGGLIAFASYNPVKNNVLRDVYTLSLANIITSLYTAFVIFSVLGYKGYRSFEKCVQNNIDKIIEHHPNDSLHINEYLSPERYQVLADINFRLTTFEDAINYTSKCDFQKSISDAAEGTGLAFIVFTQAMVEFPISPFWAIIFFLMLLMLGLGSMFGTLEGVITSIYDLRLFPWLKKPVLTGILCAVSFLIGLIFVTRAGEYYVKLFDSFAGSYGLMAVAFFEVIGVIYVYGWQRFIRDIEWMTGSRPGIYWIICWRFVAPVIMLTLFTSSLVMTLIESADYFAYNSETVERELSGTLSTREILASQATSIGQSEPNINPDPELHFGRRH